MLDEPTNHLDADGLRRLAALMQARSGGIVIVSHDRALLTAAVDEILELEGAPGRRLDIEADGARTSASAPRRVTGPELSATTRSRAASSSWPRTRDPPPRRGESQPSRSAGARQRQALARVEDARRGDGRPRAEDGQPGATR
jgi:ATPase subunit of ABC transporter with duplicated ATPase domains